MKYVNQPVRKTDAMALVTGKPVYTDDLAPKDCLIVKILRSPHANAWVEDIKTGNAEKVAGIACILTYKDVPQKRFTLAGQTAPEMSPDDRLIIDRHVRFVGDVVAIVAGETEEAVDKALKRIKVQYRVEAPVLDMHKAKDNPILVHPEENWKLKIPLGGNNKRNLCAEALEEHGDVDKVLSECKYTVEQTYHTKANQQTMMETFRTACYMDHFGRLVVLSSTQIPFHVRRIVGRALDIPASKVRVIKPRIGGGFGAKQTSVSEIYPAIVTWKTGRPSKMIFSRYESMICSSPRHEMEITVRAGADENGIIKAIDVYTLSNTGAYGEHSSTTVGLSGHKSIGLYRHTEAYRFAFDVVYTNVQAAGAYRGYGATQGIFAVETSVNELAEKLGMDPMEIRMKNMVKEGQFMPAYYGETANSCALDKCLARVKEMSGWDEKYPRKVMPDGKIRSVGVALAMQGSCISNVDVGSATIKLGEDGVYNMSIAAADMGTGCDTILAQMAAECLDCDLDDIAVSGADTDTSPYDSGSYASSTTYVTGMAVTRAGEELKKRIVRQAAKMLKCEVDEVDFDGHIARSDKTGEEVTLAAIGAGAMCGSDIALQVTESHSSPVSPPPYMAGAVEIELDPETGHVEILDYYAVVDCGTVINPNLARVQAEGGIVQGIGMTLYENIQYTEKGQLLNNSFMQYKIPTRMDMGNLHVEFESSYEPTGPFGAKSIGEIVINTPAPALTHAIANATGLWFRELPITSEQIAMGIMENEN